MSATEIEKLIEHLKEKFNELEVLKSIEGITQSIQFHIKDLNLRYTFIIEDGKLKELVKGDFNKPDITIILEAETFVRIMKGESNPAREFMLGKIKVKGSLRDLLKFRKVLER